MPQLKVVQFANSGAHLTQCSIVVIGDGYSGAEAFKGRVRTSATRIVASPAAYAKPQLQKDAGAVASPKHDVSRNRWSEPGGTQPLYRTPVHVPPSGHTDRRRAIDWEKVGVEYKPRRRESRSRRQTPPVEPHRSQLHPRYERAASTTRRRQVVIPKDIRQANEFSDSTTRTQRQPAPITRARRGSDAPEERNPGWERRDREWSLWEQQELQAEAARRERKRVEIARRQQDGQERIAARQHFDSLNARADEGLQAAQQAWDEELDRRLGGADLTKVPLPAINLVGRLIKWAMKRGAQQQRRDIRQRREEEVLRGHRMAFRSFLSDFTRNGSTLGAQSLRVPVTVSRDATPKDKAMT